MPVCRRPRPLASVLALGSAALLTVGCATVQPQPGTPSGGTSSPAGGVVVAPDASASTSPASDFTPAATPTIVAPGAGKVPSTGGVLLAPTASGRLDGKVIAIDPGHNTVPVYRVNHKGVHYYGAGIRDCQQEGSTGADNKTPEATLVWQIAQRTITTLRAEGATVALTRPDNEGTGPCNDERAKIANRAKADLLISIHGDGSESQKNRGFFVIYSGRMLGGPAAENASAQAAATLVTDLKATSGMPMSTYVGSDADGTLRRDNELAVLNTMKTGPALLLEVGNIRQKDDWAYLTSEAGQAKFAASLAQGAGNIVLNTPSAGTPVIPPNPKASAAPTDWPAE